MSEKGFEMIRSRPVQFAQRKERVPDKTQLAKKPGIVRPQKDFEHDEPVKKKKKTDEPTETSSMTKEKARKRKNGPEEPKDFISSEAPEREPLIANVDVSLLQCYA
jgi:hypothetical protein